MFLRPIFFSSFVLLFPAITSAFFHFEPGIGYNRGHFQTDKAQGIGLSLKTGAEFQKFFLLADIGYHDLQLGSTPTSTATDAGLAIGADFRTWRFWFTYLALADLAIESGGSTTTYSGGGFKLGFSGKLSSKAYLNLEVRFIDFNELDTGAGASAATAFMDAAFLSFSWKLY